MSKDSHLELLNKRRQHLKEFIAINNDDAIYNIENNLGNPSYCSMRLAQEAQARAMLAWFEQRDLNGFRQWSYVSGRLTQKSYQIKIDTIEPLPKTFELLEPLLSNNDELINWFVNSDLGYDKIRIDKVNTLDFFAYQAKVALRGNWPLLLERCENVINNPPSSLKRWQEYNYFYYALAQGNVHKMEEALQGLIALKTIKSRMAEESGITQDLISTLVIICMKIAWRHGYEVTVDSPYVPMEWMPMTALDSYDNYYSFLK